MNKLCIKCGKEKEIKEFVKDIRYKKAHRNTCKKCANKSALTWMKKNRTQWNKIARTNAFFRRQREKEYLINILGGKCEICGYNKCFNSLDFHHKDSNKKEFKIADRRYLGIKNKNKTIKEVKKCMLVCANCHRELHYKETEQKYLKQV